MNCIPIKLILGVLLFAMGTYAVPANSKSAIAEASASGKFLCLVFYDTEDASLVELSSTVKTFLTSSKKKTAFYKAKISEPANREIAEKYQVQGLPFLLVIAPNEAITGGYPKTVTEDQLKQSLSVSDLMCKIIKPLQEQKVALVVLQNKSTKFNAESWQGVNDFASDANYTKLVASIKADPAVEGSKDFIKQCQLITPLTEAAVVVLMPPGRIAKVLTGKTTKDDILKSLQSCSSGGGKGCCSDRRFKQNITLIDSALEKVEKLQGVTFTWDRAAYPRQFFCEGKQMGLIAQDVESIIPEVVLTDAEGYKSITYDKLTAVLIEAVKDMKKQMNSQDSIIKVQSARIKALETK
jgi:hypothetical protein